MTVAVHWALACRVKKEVDAFVMGQNKLVLGF